MVIESSALEQVVAIHPAMTAEQAGFVSSQALSSAAWESMKKTTFAGARPALVTYSKVGDPSIRKPSKMK
ncbi:hypothetical protein TNCV_3636131 [Trichonephila clavipes]|nr:hypothetical protein TNCV_3636131 [Trichonephila clavipes]